MSKALQFSNVSWGCHHSLARVKPYNCSLFTDMPARVFWDFATGFLELGNCLQNRQRSNALTRAVPILIQKTDVFLKP